MSNALFNPIEYKAEQCRGWDLVAVGWSQWWATFERGGQPVSDRMVELAEIQPGQRVLDVGTGIGEPAVTAARRVGAGGRVVATDLSPQMIAIAHQRATDLGLANLEFRITDAEAHGVQGLPECAFDAVLCRWALMFFPDAEGALRGLHRLLVPGGRLVAAVWDVAARVPLLSLREEIVTRLLHPPPPPPGRPHAFDLAETGALEHLLTRAGFVGVRIEQRTAVFDFESPETFARFQEAVAGPRIPGLADQPAEFKDCFWQEVAEAARPYVSSDGRVQLPNEVICAVGRRAPGRGRDEQGRDEP